MNAFGSFGQILSLLKSMDADNSGSITESDFLAVVQRLGLGSVGEQAARTAFDRIDKNDNGKVDINEAMALIQTVQQIASRAQGGGGGGGGAAGGGGQGGLW